MQCLISQSYRTSRMLKAKEKRRYR
ncbi:hypothetical protein MTR67_035122 [Solanum verrucosum]|uniref:Uncharacterized protein n=1 Tax=Solanum verrucosum TaxID=315347 RepID=A0AAF0U9C5_SOLVR|nr:hypothetical protein MTR67_035122 [Solanum verrucosum]